MATGVTMAKKAEISRKEPVEQILFRSDHVFLCLLVHRRHRLIRVIDFRTGNFPLKKIFIQSVAQREQAHKVFTLVERDEVTGWQRLGFTKEGTIPGYYKRSDAFLMSRFADGTSAAPPDDKNMLADARKVAKEIPEPTRGFKLRAIAHEEAITMGKKLNGRRPLTQFDPFGRGGLRLYLGVGLDRHPTENVISTEYQDCFSNAYIEFLYSPKDPAESGATLLGLRTMLQEIQNRGIVAAYGFGRADDEALAAVFIAAGFRKTGRLAQHDRDGDKFVDAYLFTKKLQQPDMEPLPDGTR